MTIDGAARTRIGRTPEARVRWLLAFAGRDLARLSAPARQQAWDGVFALQSGQPVRVSLHRETLEETHAALRACIESLANGRPHNLFVPGMFWTLRPPARRPTGARRSGPIQRESVEATIMRDQMPPAVVFAFVDDLNMISPDRLQACPYTPDEGPRCGRIFLARRRQRYCSRAHAQAVAWRTYAKTAKRKLGRR